MMSYIPDLQMRRVHIHVRQDTRQRTLCDPDDQRNQPIRFWILENEQVHIRPQPAGQQATHRSGHNTPVLNTLLVHELSVILSSLPTFKCLSSFHQSEHFIDYNKSVLEI